MPGIPLARVAAKQLGASLSIARVLSNKGAYAVLADLFRSLNVHVTCSNAHCWRSGGVLDGLAFIAHFGGDYLAAAIFGRRRCCKCGVVGHTSLTYALNPNAVGDRIAGPTWPRIGPPAR